MKRFEFTELIYKPMEDVFPRITDSEAKPKWLSEVRSSHFTSKGPIGVDTTFADSVSFMGRSFEFHFVITQYDPHQYIAYRSNGSGVDTKVEYSLENQDRNTRLTVTVEIEFPWYLRLLGPVLTVRVRKSLSGNYGRLKLLAESE